MYYNYESKTTLRYICTELEITLVSRKTFHLISPAQLRYCSKYDIAQIYIYQYCNP